PVHPRDVDRERRRPRLERGLVARPHLGGEVLERGLDGGQLLLPAAAPQRLRPPRDLLLLALDRVLADDALVVVELELGLDAAAALLAPAAALAAVARPRRAAVPLELALGQRAARRAAPLDAAHRQHALLLGRRVVAPLAAVAALPLVAGVDAARDPVLARVRALLGALGVERGRLGLLELGDLVLGAADLLALDVALLGGGRRAPLLALEVGLARVGLLGDVAVLVAQKARVVRRLLDLVFVRHLDRLHARRLDLLLFRLRRRRRRLHRRGRDRGRRRRLDHRHLRQLLRLRRVRQLLLRRRRIDPRDVGRLERRIREGDRVRRLVLHIVPRHPLDVHLLRLLAELGVDDRGVVEPDLALKRHLRRRRRGRQEQDLLVQRAAGITGLRLRLAVDRLERPAEVAVRLRPARPVPAAERALLARRGGERDDRARLDLDGAGLVGLAGAVAAQPALIREHQPLPLAVARHLHQEPGRTPLAHGLPEGADERVQEERRGQGSGE